ncbi:MAG: ZIP family metal transporter [Flavobacteriales bacterium]|nr:ZIP family metal transporter [Flavobacteriales bacterium]
MNDIIVYISLFLVAFLGGLLVVWKKPKVTQNFKLLLSFSGAFLLAICFLHLIPELYHDYSPSIGLFILIGFVLQLLLEFFSQGIEHGHLHHHSDKKALFPYTIFISLCFHALMEGMALTDPHHHDDGQPLLLGILIHKFPVAIILCTLLLANGVKNSKLIFSLIVFSLAAPIGLFIANQLGHSLEHDTNMFLALAVGIFLHISTTILFETSEGHKFHLKKFVSIIIGLLAAIIML